MGQSFQGSFLAFCSHVLRYGFLTINGRTGGWREEACTVAASTTAARLESKEGRMVPAPRMRKNEGSNSGEKRR